VSLTLTLLFLFLPVMISGLLILNVKISESGLKLILSFSAAYLLALCFLHLLPEIFSEGNTRRAGVFILVGFFIQLLLEFFSTGIEHGHIHVHHHHHSNKLPFSIVFGLFFHSLLEGMPVSEMIRYEDTNSLVGFKNSLVFGITLHNIPISIAFMTLMIKQGLSKQKAVMYLFLFALMAPLGASFNELLKILGVAHIEFIMQIALGIVIGIFLHISTTIMFESSGKNHRYHITKIVSILLGALVAYFIN
jgi:zinc and cadmium transporter